MSFDNNKNKQEEEHAKDKEHKTNTQGSMGGVKSPKIDFSRESSRSPPHRNGSFRKSSSARLLTTLKDAIHTLHLPGHDDDERHDEEQLKRFVQRHNWAKVLEWLKNEEAAKKKREKGAAERGEPNLEANTKTLQNGEQCKPMAAEQTRVAKDTHRQENALHVMCRHHPPICVVTKTLRLLPHLAMELNASQETPLHVAASHGASPGVIHQLIKKYPQACHMQDERGRTPLHGHLYESCSKYICDPGYIFEEQEEHRVDSEQVHHTNQWLVTEGPGVMPIMKNYCHEIASTSDKHHYGPPLEVEATHSPRSARHHNRHSQTRADGQMIHVEGPLLPVVRDLSRQISSDHLHHPPLVSGPSLPVIKDLCHHMTTQDMVLKDQSGQTPFDIATKLECDDKTLAAIKDAM